MKVLITGADGFIAKNLKAHLDERADITVVPFTRTNKNFELADMLQNVDFVFHLAGVNRTQDTQQFKIGNRDLTFALCEALASVGRSIPILFSSSTQASLQNPYGISKQDAETVLRDYSARIGAPVYIYRLPNVFGKWAKPNYNSAVATFCHNIARDLPIQINDSSAELSLVFIDDVVKQFIAVMDGVTFPKTPDHCVVQPIYKTTVGDLAHQIHLFRESRDSLMTESVGTGLVRALYSTYMSYLSPEQFAYPVQKHADPRGVFVEMLKTPNAGQFSFFTAFPGVTRGGHYHHTKTEKFLVIKGHARFCFRHILSGEHYELFTQGDSPIIVETVPGWTHDITNVGEDEMIVMLWANEVFDRAQPDTYTCPV